MIKSIKLVGDKELIITLQNIGNNLSKVGEPLTKSATYMKKEAVRNFPARGSIMQEGGWPPLSERTKRYKKKHFPGKPIMVRTGKLKGSFQITSPKITKEGGSIETYNPIKYGEYHQSGVGILPRRTLLKFRKKHVAEIKKIFETWINKVINKSVKKK